MLGKKIAGLLTVGLLVGCGQSNASGGSANGGGSETSAAQAKVKNYYTESRAWVSVYNDRPGPVLFASESSQGEAIDTKQWIGKVVVVNFWYAGCGPCVREAPELAQAAKSHPDAKFLGINIADSNETIKEFAKEHGIEFPNINDSSRALSRTVSNYVPLQSIPSTLVIDTEGRLAVRYLGELNAAELDKSIKLAAEPAA